jgi:RNA polymerase sigma-70 factor (ECF subfamily)
MIHEKGQPESQRDRRIGCNFPENLPYTNQDTNGQHGIIQIDCQERSRSSGSKEVQEVDKETILEAQKGSDTAFERLVDHYQVTVFNLCYRMTGDPSEAEDAAQETFIRAYKGIAGYDSRRSFSTWILSIAAHYCIDQLRKKRLSYSSLHDLPNEDIRDPGTDPESTLSKKEHDQQVRKLLDVLNPADRASVIMYYWYNLSYEEISKVLNITPSAVKSRLHRARLELARCWRSTSASFIPSERQRNESPAV